MLNKQKGNMYSFVTHTWNPIKGKCSHDCSYCLDGDTLILMADLSFKKLKDVIIGDIVMGTEKTSQYSKLSPSRVIGKAIRVIGKAKKEDYAYKIDISDTSIICSSNHKWLIDRGRWRSIVDGLKVGMQIKQVTAIKTGYSKILSCQAIGMRKLYDIQTTTQNFIANGFVSHNCYMKAFKNLGELRLDEKSLKDDLGSGNFIFVGSSTDMFADDVPVTWIRKVLCLCNIFDKNKYLFQTKNPRAFEKFKGLFPSDSIYGVTIETNRENDLSNAPSRGSRLHWIAYVDIPEPRMVSIEPIMDFDLDEMVDWIYAIKPKFVSIGADSKGHHLPEPSSMKIESLIKKLQEFTEVKIKTNMGRLRK